MVKIFNAIIVAALIAAPALAYSQEQPTDLVSRDIFEEASNLLGRDISSLDDLSERDVDELYERDPSFFKKLFSVGKQVAGHVAGSFFGRDFEDIDDVSTRELAEFLSRDFDELEEREPFFWMALARPAAKLAKKAVGHLMGREIEDLDDLSARELEEFEERCFGAVARTLIKKGQDNDAQQTRDFDELTERDFEDFEELSERELEELEDLALREPNKFFNGLKKGFGKVASLFLGGRDFEDFQDLTEREFEDLEDLARREPNKFFNGLKKGFGKVASMFLGRRDFEDFQDLTERDMEIDELD